MSSSNRVSPSLSKGSRPLAPEGTVEIAPGMYFPLKQLLTKSGRAEAESLIKQWMRQHRDPLQFIPPEKFKIDQYGIYGVLDVQQYIAVVTKMITSRISYHTKLWEHPDAPPLIVKRVREIIQREIRSRLKGLTVALIEDAFFETILSLQGEINYLDGRMEVKKEWIRRINKRSAKKKRLIMIREGLFPTPYLLRQALREAVDSFLDKDPAYKITQSEVARYFSETEKYVKCGDESSLRRWLRIHDLRWKDLVKDLRREHKIKSYLKSDENLTP